TDDRNRARCEQLVEAIGRHWLTFGARIRSREQSGPGALSPTLAASPLILLKAPSRDARTTRKSLRSPRSLNDFLIGWRVRRQVQTFTTTRELVPFALNILIRKD